MATPTMIGQSSGAIAFRIDETWAVVLPAGLIDSMAFAIIMPARS
jgi:hypothetical protein